MDLQLLGNVGGVTTIAGLAWGYLDRRKEVQKLTNEKAALIAERDALQAKVKALESQISANWPSPPLSYPHLGNV